MPTKKGYHFGKTDAGAGRGFNDSGIDHFKKESSIWKEAEQNVGDNKDESNDLPAEIIFSKTEMNVNVFGIDKNYINTFKAAYERSKILSDKDDVKMFYKKGLEILKKKKISVFKISDYNTSGLNENPFRPQSNFYRLIIAEGSSSESGRSGGSHGHGQKAPFARSGLRNIYYYSYVSDGIQGTEHNDLFIGKTILNEWLDKSGKRRQHVGYYGNIDPDILEEKDQPVPLFDDDIPSEIKRTDQKTGLDIYILAAEMTHMWKHSAIVQSLRYFYAAIEYGLLKIGFESDGQVEFIDKETLDSYVADKTPYLSHHLKAMREPINGKPFTREIEHLGNVKLYISIHEGGNQMIDLMRRPRMRIIQYDKPTLSNYSGVILIDDIKGNLNLRLLEDPEHKKLERWRSLSHFGDEVTILKDLEGFIDDTLHELRKEQINEPFSIPGLGKIFPDLQASNDYGDQKGDDQEVDTNQIPDNVDVQVSDKITLTAPKLSSSLKVGTGNRGSGGGGSGSGGGSGGGSGDSGGEDEGGGVISLNDIQVRTYHVGDDKGLMNYRSIINVKTNCEGWMGIIAHGIDSVHEPIKITNFSYDKGVDSYDVPIINDNRLNFGKLKKGSHLSFTFSTNLKVKSALITEG